MSCACRESLAQLSTFSAAMNASCGMSTLPNCRILNLPSAFPEARVRLDCAGSDEFGKHPTDHTRCDDGVVPLICPTCQMVSQDVSGITPAVGGYFAWGCFRYFCCLVTEASDRT
jgi:ssDNA-binding Zn-finger/Zn-ribbon topoisomerase 1